MIFWIYGALDRKIWGKGDQQLHETWFAWRTQLNRAFDLIRFGATCLSRL
jgi:hypothetical protein